MLSLTPRSRPSILFHDGTNAKWIAIVTSFVVCWSMLFSTLVIVPPATVKGQARPTRERPERGRPAARMPNLDQAKREQRREPATRIPRSSPMRAPRKPLLPRNGVKVGDPGTGQRFIGMADQTPGNGPNNLKIAKSTTSPSARSQKGKLNHATTASRFLPEPPVADDAYVQWFFTYGLGRHETIDELDYWRDMLRRAYPQGQPSLVMAIREMGKTLFESVEYATRTRSDHEFVYDLYKVYLLREPDSGGWEFWEGQVPDWGREGVRRAFDECDEFLSKVATVTVTGSASSTVSSLLAARLDPRNQPGRQNIAQDAEWSTRLLALPGRAGLDLDLGLSYSSAAVWTNSGPYTYFDEDVSSVAPGFRLGFPTVQEKFFNAEVGQNAYLLINSDGRRVELRQVGATNLFESADSTYLQLTDNSTSNPSTLLLRSSDGKQMSYRRIENGWRCVEIKDRNGNFITVNYNGLGDLSSIVDTLARQIVIDYDSRGNLSSITQMWNGQAHVWATFEYDRVQVRSARSCGNTAIAAVGVDLFTPNGGCVVGVTDDAIPVLTQVTLDDGSRYTFEYNAAGTISVFRRFSFDNVERSALAFGYREHEDSPRIVTMSVTADNWTGLNDVPGEVLTEFGTATDGACRTVSPDGTILKEYYGTGWQRGLVTSTKTFANDTQEAANTPLKTTTTTWTQDNTNLSYALNPRVIETNTYDAGGNRRRTTVGFTSPFTLPGGTSCTLPSDIYEYDADATTVLRRTHTDYNFDSAYISSTRRIIGLVNATFTCDGSQGAVPCGTNSGSALVSKVSYHYDESGSAQFQGAPVQHDETNYGTGFLQGRANLSSTRRYDVNSPTQYLASSAIYNTAGSTISVTDAASHQSLVSYGDSFSADGTSNTSLSFITLAYPTTLTDADGHSSSVKYHYDLGLKTRVQGPPPANQSQGAIQIFAYDDAGRMERVTTVNNGAYRRLWYGGDYIASFSTINNVADEGYSIQTFDGLGRAVGSATNNPGSTGGYSAQLTTYDLMGRAAKQSNPTEINGNWVPTGDDSAGWIYTQQTYDWQGRPLLTTNPDMSVKSASYTSSCGCAGGDVVTTTDEGTRVDPLHNVTKKHQQRVYNDALGRPWKTELLNWESGTPYETTVSTYNARNQVTLEREFDGAGPATPSDQSCPSGSAMRFGTDTSWKQSLTETEGWQNPNFDDSSWSAAVDEGAYGTAPWGTTPTFPSGTPAHWIWHYDSRSGSDQSIVYFRKTFTATTTSAQLRITADNTFYVYLNGTKVADGPSNWMTPINVALPLIQGSTNTIAVIVFNFGGAGGLLADMDTGSACQQTNISYDGHGRMQSKHKPEEGAGTATTWEYYPDDTVQKTTDARGASSNYAYNGRQMTTSVTYAAPAGITIPTAESYTYDAAGNRTSMTDASGSLTYQYNQLSQLESETKFFNGLGTSRMASYQYNFAGQLKLLTYHDQSTISYGIDTASRTTSVAGSPPYQGVTNYVTNISYRASGQPKQILYGNDTLLEMSYTSRLQLLRYNMKSYVFQGQRYDTHKVDHQYNPDGSLFYAHDITDERYDRAFNYDQLGRLTEAYSGQEARSFANQPSSTAWGPYRQIYQHNAWSDMTRRTSDTWSQSDTVFGYFVNGRNQDSTYQYDANGNVRFDRDLEYKYDASGTNFSVRSLIDNVTVTQTVDGDGELLKRQTSQTLPTYYFRSTVLAGKILAELNNNGQTIKSYVYLEGEVLAVRENGNLLWRHENPMTGARGESVWQGFYQQIVEPDSTGVNVGFQDPWNIPPETFPDPDLANPDPGGTGGQCRVNMVVIHCSAAQLMLASGSALRCPNDNCSSQWNGREFRFPTYTATGLTYALLNGEDSSEQQHASPTKTRTRGNNKKRRKRGGKKPKPQPTPEPKKEPKPEGSAKSIGGHLSPCLQDALRQYFPAMQAQGNTYSPAEAATFKPGIPKVFQLGGKIPGTVAPGAITLGLYDIYYDTSVFSIDGGSNEQLFGVLEEVSHTVQFIKIWSELTPNPIGRWGVSWTDYNAAKGAWQDFVVKHWAAAGFSYDNAVERWAKANANRIMRSLLTDPDVLLRGTLCGYNMSEYIYTSKLEEPN